MIPKNALILAVIFISLVFLLPNAEAYAPEWVDVSGSIRTPAQEDVPLDYQGLIGAKWKDDRAELFAEIEYEREDGQEYFGYKFKNRNTTENKFITELKAISIPAHRINRQSAVIKYQLFIIELGTGVTSEELSDFKWTADLGLPLFLSNQKFGYLTYTTDFDDIEILEVDLLYPPESIEDRSRKVKPYVSGRHLSDGDRSYSQLKIGARIFT
jgi:hypothetical protein